jgi:hypothetical protein
MSEGKLFGIKYLRHDCWHPSVELDMETRQVKCNHCERIIDPFDFLFRCSTTEDNVLAQLARYQAELAKVKLEIEQLKKKRIFLNNPLKQ